MAHGKGNKKNLTLTVGQGGNDWRWGKKFTVRQCKKRKAKFVFAVGQEKTHDKVCVCRAPMQKRTANIFLAVRSFRRAYLKKRTAKHLFAVRRKNTHDKHLGARQIWSFP
jgi:hypothetical protein